ncbi:MAG: acetyl-CoA acetyltransferase [Actinomycetota bacterium]|nr:acetyl-CoA acetyltransferase [Actinomycetota bacterium]
MTIDPRTPVLIGAGQFLHRTSSSGGGLDDALDPSTLMAEAIRLAATDAGLASVPQPDSWRVISLLSWRYGDPAWVVAQRLGLEPRDTAITTMGGNSPQTLLNSTALEIQRGEVDLVVLTGGEAWRTRMRARAADVELPWPKAPEDRMPRLLGDDLQMNLAAERDRGVSMPVQVYPMFETAIRAAAGRTMQDHQRVIGELWARFSEVAAANPNAWLREARTAAEITTPTAKNRMIGFPYTKSMVSNNDVDMAAAVIMCSAERAAALGVPRDRWVFPHAGADCHEHVFISNRFSFADTPAVELGGRRALQLAGLSIDDVELVDLYSCFPSAVQLGAQSLGLSLDRPLTVTGGLCFAGGPWNSYVMHSIAAMVQALRERPGANGLVWANGGYATKHAFGVYSTTPPAAGFRHAYPQAEIDAMPRRELAEGAEDAGAATIEAYTVMHSRDGVPETALAACLLPDGRRAWGKSTETELAAAMCVGEWVGRGATVGADGTLRVA